jgi:hypothetical protein
MPKKGAYRIIAIVCILMFMLPAAGFAGNAKDDELVIGDLILVKPLGFAALIAGGVTYLVSLPVTLPLGWKEKAYKSLVKKPYEFTFQRELGEDLDEF